MLNCLVSVIIPTYNRANTILQSVESVLNQTHKKLEVIVVDDGSTDHTERLFANYPDVRVKYVKYSPNQGACYARNYGIALSRGEYIAFQDSDDIWKSDKLAKQLDYLKKTDADFVFCGMNRENPMTGEHFYYPSPRFNDGGNLLEKLLIENAIATQTMLMKREILNHVQFDVNFKRYQDLDFALQVIMHGFRVKYLNEALVDSIIQKNSITVTVDNGKAYEHLLEKYKNQYQKYPKGMSSIYSNLARSFRETNRKKTIQYLWMSLHYRFHVKTVAKLVLYYMHLWN